ncbi:c(7)-type cytochrome triheme domain-containing protein [Gemmatimonadota bacterium]
MATLTLVSGCRSAAEAFLDLPPAAEEPAASAASTAGVADTIRIAPPIEAYLDEDSVLAALPMAFDGAVDWVAAYRDGTIDPMDGPGPKSEGSGFGYDFYFGAFETYFPHSEHNAWLDCRTCHGRIYRKTGESTTMKDINAGKSCGVCHGSVAFPATACERCHPQMTMPEGRLDPALPTPTVFVRDSTKEQSIPLSIFSHGVHRIRYQCSACHPDPFPTSTDTFPVTMSEMSSGVGCGACHDGESAFAISECGRCHQAQSTPPP